MSKKIISLLLSLMLIVTSLSVTILSVSAASGDTGFFVSGSAALTGAEWSQIPSDDTVMTANDDGTYSKVFTDVQPASGLILKVVGYVEKEDGTYDLTWYGVDGGEDNLQINVKEACDVTVTFDPATKKIDATGAGVSVVSDLVVDNMYAVGAGSGGFLYDVVWDPADDANIMEEVAPGVYQITYEDVEVYDNYEFKFAANGAYADQWGAPETGFTAPIGEDFALASNSNTANITLAIPGDEDGYVNVTLTIDISNFDYATKEGATARVDVEYPEDPQPTDPEPTDPQPTDPQPTDPEPTDPQPTDPDAPYLTVNATSNYFPNFTEEFTADTNQVVVTYYIDPSKNILDTEWYLNYDPEVLTVSKTSTYCPIMVATGGVVLNRDVVGQIKFNATNLSLYDFTTTDGLLPFATITFDVNDISASAPVTTTVDLDVSVLRFSLVSDPSDPFSQSDKSEEVLLVDNHEVLNNDQTATLTVATDTDIVDPNAPVPTDPQPTDPVPTDPQPTDPEPTDPQPTDPVSTDPQPTDPVSTDPQPTDPVTTDPQPTDPVTTDPQPTDPVTTDPQPTDPVTTDPQPTDPVDEPTDPVDEPTTPVDEPTTPVDEPTTPVVVPGDTTPDATSGVNGGSTADTPNGSTNNGGTVNGGAVQTGDVSLAVVILSILIAATGVMFVLRKREMF